MIISEFFVKISVKYKSGLSLYKIQLKSVKSQIRNIYNFNEIGFARDIIATAKVIT